MGGSLSFPGWGVGVPPLMRWTGPHPFWRIRSRSLAYLTLDQREEDAHNTENGKEDEPDMRAGLERGVIRGGYLHGPIMREKSSIATPIDNICPNRRIVPTIPDATP